MTALRRPDLFCRWEEDEAETSSTGTLSRDVQRGGLTGGSTVAVQADNGIVVQVAGLPRASAPNKPHHPLENGSPASRHPAPPQDDLSKTPNEQRRPKEKKKEATRSKGRCQTRHQAAQTDETNGLPPPERRTPAMSVETVLAQLPRNQGIRCQPGPGSGVNAVVAVGCAKAAIPCEA
ncbi:hypothetical protein CDD80_3797 [Ophiocordyceps camponoti-rufipedis]|uniref:Uncharacterized protein n=1 Tax=Ophiocordyceps camponoti-rufipedis TaxID=2004952 RepID=A0A2C5Z0D7_9HYPO|nr:hypothetical protein CDD80_3797 [Ophiocordyceps camponoti-rufipedis]